MTNLSSAILDPLLRDDPAGPRITYYDCQSLKGLSRG